MDWLAGGYGLGCVVAEGTEVADEAASLDVFGMVKSRWVDCLPRRLGGDFNRRFLGEFVGVNSYLYMAFCRVGRLLYCVAHEGFGVLGLVRCGVGGDGVSFCWLGGWCAVFGLRGVGGF